MLDIHLNEINDIHLKNIFIFNELFYFLREKSNIFINFKEKSFFLIDSLTNSLSPHLNYLYNNNKLN